MSISLEQIKELRERTGVSMMACKKVLEESAGDIDKAIELLRKKGEAKAEARSGRTTGEGVIQSYVHQNLKIGALIHVACETDFVAKNEDFVSVVRDIAMHITAMNPLVLSADEVSDELVAKEKEIWKEQLLSEGKKEEMIEKIMIGKENKFRSESALLNQPFVKNPEVTIDQLVKDLGLKMGENIKIVRFIRFGV